MWKAGRTRHGKPRSADWPMWPTRSQLPGRKTISARTVETPKEEKRIMMGSKKISMAAWLAAALLISSSTALAQSGQQNPPPAQQSDKDKKPVVQDLTLDTAAPPVSAEEDAAYKAFADELDTKKKIQ